MSGNVWHQDDNEIVQVNSYLTGNTIFLNKDADRFFIRREWSTDKVSAALLRLHERRRSDLTRECGPTKLVFALILEVGKANTPQELGHWLDRLFKNAKSTWDIKDGERSPGWRSSDKTYVRRFLTDLWDTGLILFPMNFPFKQTRASSADSPNHKNFFHELDLLEVPKVPRPVIYRFVYCTAGISSINDLVPELVNHWLAWRADENWHFGTCNLVVGRKFVAYQQAHATVALRHGLADYVNPNARTADRYKNGLDFKWVSNADPNMEEWRECAADFIVEGLSSRAHAQGSLNTFLQYLLDNPNLSRDPATYCDKNNVPQPKFKNTHYIAQNCLHLWFDWIIENRLTELDERTGELVRLPWVKNPIPRFSGRKEAKPQTDRSAMPLMLVQKCIDVLTEDDWAWAKSTGAGDTKQQGDWFNRYDGEKKTWAMTWSPVRSILMFIKLRTVFRTFQVRMLDSGESDTKILILSDKDLRCYQLLPNPNNLAHTDSKNPVEKGVLQARPDEQTGELIPFLRLSTNKTADQDKDAWEKGYDCPWAPDDVIEKLMYLRRWQETNNPLICVTEWKDVEELSHAKRPEQLHNMRGCFLFRDPTSRHPSNPVTSGKIHVFWVALCKEVERRLKEEGLTNSASCSHYRLVDDEMAWRPYYDLHSLRVTHISSLYKGGLPVKVIMMITGHATVPMCLYYTKYGISEVREAITKAEAARISQSQREWVTHLQEQELRSLEPLLAVNDQQAISDFFDGNQGLVFMDSGICTAGCGKCSTGIVLKQRSSKYSTIFGPVIGGRANCCSCRYFVTGPPFLHGLQASFNVKSLKASEIATRRGQAETQKAVLEMERHECLAAGIHFEKWESLKDIMEDFDRLTSEIDQAFDEMRAVSIMVAQSLGIQNHMQESGSHTDKFALITSDWGSVRLAFEESTEFDLIDQVLQASVVFETVQGETTERANYKRMRYYDKMLDRHGLPPAFLWMDDKTALEAGNAFSRLLKARVGRKNTLDLLAGVKTLEDLNILPQAFYEEITTRIFHPINIESSNSLKAITKTA